MSTEQSTEIAEKKENSYNLQKIWAKQHEVIRQHTIGIKPKDIAKSLGLNVQTIYNITNCKMAQYKINELQGRRDASFIEIQEHIRALQPLALEVVQDSLTEDSGLSVKDKTKTALEVLAMGGHGAVKKYSNSNGALTDEDRIKINQIAMEIQGGLQNKAEDADFREISNGK